MHKNTTLNNVYIILIFAFIFAPIIYLTYYSFNAEGNMINFTGVSFKAYEDLAKDTNIQIVFLNTLVVGILASLIATVVGVLGSLKLYFISNKIEKSIFRTINNVLLVSPDVLIGSLFLTLFLILQIKLGFITVLIAHVAFSIPVVIILIYPKLKKMNKDILKASNDLGASDWQTIRQVIIPFLESSIFAAFFIALTYSLDDFAVTFFVTGNGFSTLSVEIYSMARQGIDLKINALATLIFVVTSVIVIINYIVQNRKEVKYEKN